MYLRSVKRRRRQRPSSQDLDEGRTLIELVLKLRRPCLVFQRAVINYVSILAHRKRIYSKDTTAVKPSGRRITEFAKMSIDRKFVELTADINITIEIGQSNKHLYAVDFTSLSF